ncbi:MAG: pyridoxal-phosphate dependent enzyme [Candidatus Riflebacteria bacterium]|nr:pyridoxal-phosphate dependent enzyme [Candidatus Riflebacteria bacterium]
MATPSEYAADLATVRAAAARIAGHVHRTPVVTCSTLDLASGRALFFKCENFQKVGAFKFRGACNAVMQLDAATARHGVVTHSSGNHAQALALAARMRGIPAHVVMPRTSSAVKRRAVKDYGARVVECEPTLPARETTARAVLEETGGVLIPSYDHPDVIAGQGTAALELLEDAGPLDAIVAPVGGGGLLSGVCVAARGLCPTVRVFGAEPAGDDDAARSKAGGRLVLQTDPRTVADGLLTSLGALTWPIIRDRVERILGVDEEEIVRAMRLTWERAKLLIEPSSAVAIAAVLCREFRELEGIRRVGIVLSGGNVDLPCDPATVAARSHGAGSERIPSTTRYSRGVCQIARSCSKIKIWSSTPPTTWRTPRCRSTRSSLGPTPVTRLRIRSRRRQSRRRLGFRVGGARP